MTVDDGGNMAAVSVVLNLATRSPCW